MDPTQPSKPVPPIAPKAPACSKCGGQMQEGFIPDQTEGGVQVSKWIEGPPEYGFFGTVRHGRKAKNVIHTFACLKCGYLESYISPARPAPSET